MDVKTLPINIEKLNKSIEATCGFSTLPNEAVDDAGVAAVEGCADISFLQSPGKSLLLFSVGYLFFCPLLSYSLLWGFLSVAIARMKSD